jgi:hypothetical protein
VKVKNVQKASDQVQSGNMVPATATIMAHYRKVVLCVDVATPALSWDDVARKGQAGDKKEMRNRHYFYDV